MSGALTFYIFSSFINTFSVNIERHFVGFISGLLLRKKFPFSQKLHCVQQVVMMMMMMTMQQRWLSCQVKVETSRSPGEVQYSPGDFWQEFFMKQMWELKINNYLIFVLLLFSQSFHHWKGIKMRVSFILFSCLLLGSGFFSLLTQTLFCVVAAPGIVPSLFNSTVWVGILFYFALRCWFLTVASTSSFVRN